MQKKKKNSIEMIPNDILFYHRVLLCPAIIREVSSSGRWEHMQKPKSDIQKESKLEVSISLSPGSSGVMRGRGGRKIVGIRGERGL